MEVDRAQDTLAYPLGDRTPAPGELIEVVPGVRWWRTPVPGPLRHVNGYVLDDGDGVTLVDTGLNTDTGVAAWKALFAGPLAGTRVARIVGTHFHPDHIGLAGWLARQHRAELWMTQAEWLTGRMALLDAQPEVPREAIAFRRAAGWSEEEIARATDWSMFARLVSRLPQGYRRLREGDVLDMGQENGGASRWRIVTGNGHSPEHACLLDEERGLFIAGDQVLPRISSNISVGVGEPMADPLGDWLGSIAKLRTLPADLLVLPGHGEPFTGLHPRLDQLAEEHRTRLDALAAHLAGEPRRVTDCFPALFDRPIGPDVIGLATGEALAHLRRLEQEGGATREERDGVWWFGA